MTKLIDFYFDFISPYSYLAYKKIKFSNEININRFNLKPILLGGLHKLGEIIPPAFNKRKLKHMKNDCQLIAKKNNIEFIWNEKFPINSLNLMRGYLYISEDTKRKYFELCFDAYWKNNLDLTDDKNLKKILHHCEIDSKIFLNKINNQIIKDELKSLNQKAFDLEVFGAPTFVVNNKIFWGQDRLEYALDEISD